MSEDIKICIWDREFFLPVDYDCSDDENVFECQIEAFSAFLNHPEWTEKARELVKEYCESQMVGDEERLSNIFSYIIPESVFVKHTSLSPPVALLCKYRYDFEHGLAIVFLANGEITVGSQDIIL